MTSPPPVITLSQLLDTLDLEQVNAEFFVGNQIDEIGHHVSGGHIAAQALMAASRTVPERLPHSMHMYFLRPGDARHPVDFEVTALHDGGTFSARRVTARQFGSVLLEGIASFSKSVEALSTSNFHRIYRILNPYRASPTSIATTPTNAVAGGCASSPSTGDTWIRRPGWHPTWPSRRPAFECGGAPTALPPLTR